MHHIIWPIFWHWALIILAIVIVISIIVALCNDEFETFLVLDTFLDFIGDIFDSFHDD
jgi:hypothetical protein